MSMLCIVTDKMDMDLAKALSKKLVTLDMRPFITYSIFCAIKVRVSYDVNNFLSVCMLNQRKFYF